LVSALVPLERADHQREPVLPGQQPDGDLRLQPALFGEAGLAEPVALAGLEVTRAHVAEHQRRRPEPGMRSARLRQPLPPLLLRIDGQPALDSPAGGRRDAGLLENPQAVKLADRLDDPGQNQVAEHAVPAGRGVEPGHLVAALERVEQTAHPRRGDRQPTAARRLQAQAEFRLPGRDPLPPRGLQHLHPGLVVRRPQVLDLPRAPPRRPHDLHRRRARLRPHRPHIRHQPTLRATVSAQLQPPGTESQQLTGLHQSRPPDLGLSQVKHAPPVLIMGCHPLIASVTVGSHLIELRAAARSPAEFKLDNTAGRHHSRLGQRTRTAATSEAQPRERAGVR